MHRNPRDELKYVLDPRYRKSTALGTYVEGQSLIRSYKPRGPDGFPFRNPHIQNQQQPLLHLIEPYDETDQPPEFTLQDFLCKLSKEERMPLEKTKKIVFSKRNYQQMQNMIQELCQAPQKSNALTRVEVQIPDEATKPAARIPQRQLLVEMAALVREQISQVMSCVSHPKFFSQFSLLQVMEMDMTTMIRPLPRFSPSNKPGLSAPHTEIVLLENIPGQTSLKHLQYGLLPD
jgi:hypothetical protein